MQNEIKVRLINSLEERLGIHLQPKQLEFIFSDASVTTLTAPRKYGKDTITAIKIALAILENEEYRIGVVLPSRMSCQIFFDKLQEIFNAMLPGFIASARKNPFRIEAINGSNVFIFHDGDSMRGHRLHEAYILEFYHLRDFSDIYNTLTVSLLWNVEYKMNMIGTPGVNNNRQIEEILRGESGCNHLRVGIYNR